MKALVALAVLVSLSAGAARAASAIDPDVRCLAISDRIAQSTDARAKETGKLGQVFFLGRINAAPGGGPSAPVLATAMVDAARHLSPAVAKTEANRCSALMKGAISTLEAAGPIANRTLRASKPAPK